MITLLEPDILECEVKWALGSITTNKVSGGDRIPAELFQILKDDAVKVLHSICQQNLENSAVATGLEKVSFHSNPKERQCQRMFKLLYYTIALSSLASKVMLKILQSKFQKYVNGELPAGSTSWILKRQRNQRSNCQHLLDHGKNKTVPEKYLFLLS